MELQWWRQGLRFSCLGCGRCCRGEPGAIFFSSEEETGIAASLNLSIEDFRRLYVTARWSSPSIGEHPDGRCLFYDSDSDRCRIYTSRPLQCRTWPFWPENLSSPDRWAQTARRCPGMDQGEHHPAEQVEALLRRHLRYMEEIIP
ncbi:MAG: zinc/iron-chelating domain-containing protein [Dethiosulfovibrio peptidovorans]|nr:MAG: zinc/iron-chelating domain-containing protein [Dethiosulfovibrio peptidovorans]